MNTEKSVYALCLETPLLRDFLIARGFSQLKNDHAFQTLGKMIQLKQALKMKGIHEAVFLEEFRNYSTVAPDFQEHATAPAPLLSETSDVVQTQTDFLVSGALPCPVRLPLLDSLKHWNELHQVRNISYDLRSANLGLDFVLDQLASGRPETYPDLITSAGYELLLRPDIRRAISDHYSAPVLPFLPEMEEKIPGLADPAACFRMITVVPAVFIVNHRALNGRSVPHSWAELLCGDFRESVAIPVSDLDMHNALVITIYSKYGEKGLSALKNCFAKNLHPAQMVKNIRNEAPCISVAPYFFASMIAHEQQELIWPEDGAIVSPVFLSVKHGSEQGIAAVLDYFLSDEVSAILSHNGKFPVTSPTAGHQLDENHPLLFAGWEILNHIDQYLPAIWQSFPV